MSTNPISNSHDLTPWKSSHRFRTSFQFPGGCSGSHLSVVKLICTLKMMVEISASRNEAADAQRTMLAVPPCVRSSTGIGERQDKRERHQHRHHAPECLEQPFLDEEVMLARKMADDGMHKGIGAKLGT